MKKKLLLVGLAVIVLFVLMGTTVFADPGKVDQKVSKGIYYLVVKDANWNPLPRSTSPFGMGKFSIKDDTLTMHLVAHKLTPEDWYLVEVVDKSGGGWTSNGLA